jgi:hypothetical protein
MEEKLIKGGEVISKAAQQEAALRKAEKELRERQMQEAALARELAEKEEANLQLEEHFSSLQEEVEVKTKKLKKLWGKFQQAQREVKEQEEEFAVSMGGGFLLFVLGSDWVDSVVLVIAHVTHIAAFCNGVAYENCVVGSHPPPLVRLICLSIPASSHLRRSATTCWRPCAS